MCVHFSACICPHHRRLKTDVGVFSSPSLRFSAKRDGERSIWLPIRKVWSPFLRLKALFLHGHSQIPESRKRIEESKRIYILANS